MHQRVDGASRGPVRGRLLGDGRALTPRELHHRHCHRLPPALHFAGATRLALLRLLLQHLPPLRHDGVDHDDLLLPRRLDPRLDRRVAPPRHVPRGHVRDAQELLPAPRRLPQGAVVHRQRLLLPGRHRLLFPRHRVARAAGGAGPELLRLHHLRELHGQPRQLPHQGGVAPEPGRRLLHPRHSVAGRQGVRAVVPGRGLPERPAVPAPVGRHAGGGRLRAPLRGAAGRPLPRSRGRRGRAQDLRGGIRGVVQGLPRRHRPRGLLLLPEFVHPRNNGQSLGSEQRGLR
mmetsp:Transcript_55713/g.147157  ORF Transcript_55713/g.147157 Transcript_55713/m.147157 type:complete len:288 (+) Transcript_55713:412-1275(+)